MSSLSTSLRKQHYNLYFNSYQKGRKYDDIRITFHNYKVFSRPFRIWILGYFFYDSDNIKIWKWPWSIKGKQMSKCDLCAKHFDVFSFFFVLFVPFILYRNIGLLLKIYDMLVYKQTYLRHSFQIINLSCTQISQNSDLSIFLPLYSIF